MSACTKRAAARAAVSGFMRTSRQMLVFRDRQAASAMSSLIGLLAVRRSRPPAANLFLSLHTRHTWASAQGTLERAHGRPASPSADPTPPPAAPRTSAAPAPPPPPPPAAAAAARGSARRVGAPVKVKERRRLCLIAPVVGSQSRSAPRNRAAQRPNAASLPTRPAIAGSTLRMPLGLDRGWRFSEARAATCDQGKGGLSAFFFRGCAHCLWFFGCMEPCIQIQTVTKLSIPATTMTNAAVRLLLQLMVSLSQY